MGTAAGSGSRSAHRRLGLFLYQAIERFEVGHEPEEETRHFAPKAPVGRVHPRRRVCAVDAEVDALNEQLFRELLTFMMEDPRTIPRASRLILISRFVERVADDVTNIAEMVIYVVEGKMIRHTLA